jgi:hypothetical protein
MKLSSAVPLESLTDLRCLVRRYLAVQISLLPMTLERIRIFDQRGPVARYESAYREFDLEVQACLYAYSEHHHEPRLRLDLRNLIDR